jgi:hypothetical protein
MIQLRPLMVILFAHVLLGACERQGPPKPIGSATNKHVEETPAISSRGNTNPMIEKMKPPMDDARQTEDVLKATANRTSKQVEQAGKGN